MPLPPNYISADWPAPPTVRAFCTTRHGGKSQTPYDTFNLANHVGDTPSNVHENRQRLIHDLQLPSSPHWLNQVHGTDAICLDAATPGTSADAAYTHRPNLVCAILTADCLPVLISDTAGQTVAAIHAGWRGLVQGVIERTVQALATPPQTLLAWLGPAIGKERFVVGNDVYQAYMTKNVIYQSAFKPYQDRWLADIYALGRLTLEALGITAIFGGNFCTYQAADRFFSYRRDHGQTGRMASLIWIQSP